MRCHRRCGAARRASSGLTLIELLVAVVIMAIIASVALPTYETYVLKARRADARSALLDLAARQARHLAIRGQYATTPRSLGYTEAVFPIDIRIGQSVWYRMTVRVGQDGRGFEATATPVGAQRGDGCGIYVLDDLGLQSNRSNSERGASCW